MAEDLLGNKVMNTDKIKVVDWQQYISDGVNENCRERIMLLKSKIPKGKHLSRNERKRRSIINKEIMFWKALLRSKP